jgi:hypothetical protein
MAKGQQLLTLKTKVSLKVYLTAEDTEDAEKTK